MKLKVMLFLLMISVPLYAVEDIYQFNNSQKTAQYQNLIKNLRCLVCQNQDLADSNAKLALDLKELIYRRVDAGQDSNAIISYLTERYGDFILFKPPLKKQTYILWFSPFLFLVFGLMILFLFIRRGQNA